MKWLVLVLLTAAHVEAKELHVNVTARNCSDAISYGDNNVANPWCSLGRAAWGSTTRTSPNPSQAAAAGDIVIVHAGTYPTNQGSGTSSSTVTYQPANSGTKEKPIVFSCNVVRACLLTFTDGSFGIVLGTVGKNYVTWRGFVHDNSGKQWRQQWHATIRASVGAVIEHSTFIGDATSPLPDNNTAIFIQESSDAIIRSNRIQNFYSVVVNAANGAGVEVYLSGALTIEHNEISRAGSGVFIKAPAADCNFKHIDAITIRYNRIFDVGIGIITHRAPNTASAPLLIHQNVIANTTTGFRIWPFMDVCGSGPKHAKFINNTIYQCRNECIHLRTGALDPAAGHVVQNNIVSNSGAGLIVLVEVDGTLPSSQVAFDRNVYRSVGRFATVGEEHRSFQSWQRSHAPQDAASLAVDPLFLGDRNQDFRLKDGSPALKIGRAAFGVGGRDGAVIPAGAYIIGGETIGLLGDGGTK